MAALQRFTKKEAKALINWYKRSRRDFPWRANPEPYWVWLAEIMSQQTQMATLVPYFYRFIERFPNVSTLAQASEDEVLAAWTGLGYYSRARNIHRAAQIIAGKNNGLFPKTVEQWLALPGVGPYTAAAIASQCFGVEEPVWDGNVIRVTSRLDARGDVRASAYRAEMLEALRKIMRGHDPSSFNQALMELGATVCTPKAPACGRCPVQSACAAEAKDVVGQFPPPKPRKQTVELKCQVRVAIRRGAGNGVEAWLVRRTDEQWFSGMWDFPSQLGGVSCPVLSRDAEDTRLGPKAECVGEVRHQITNHRIRLEGWLDPVSKAHARMSAKGAWVPVDELLSQNPPLPLSTTARKILRKLVRHPKLGLN